MQEKTPVSVSGEALLRAALSSMSYAFSIWDEALTLVLYNQAYADLFFDQVDGLKPGLSLREICALSIANGNYPGVTNEALFENYGQRFKDTYLPGAKKQYEKDVKGRLIRTSHIRMPEVGWIVAHEDITDRRAQDQVTRKHQKELELQNLRLDAIVETIPHGLVLFDRSNRLVTYNRAFAEFNCLDESVLVPGTPRDVLIAYSLANGFAPAESSKTYFEEREKALKRQKSSAIVLELSDGRVIASHHHPISDGGWILFQQDITELQQKQKLLEMRSQELEQQNLRFTTAVNNMAHGLAMFDAQERLVICNAPYARLYGLSEELTEPGISFWDVFAYRAQHGMVSTEDKEQVRRNLDRVVVGGETSKRAVTMADGRVMLISHQPMADGGWLSTHEDITEQYRNQEMIAHVARHDGLTGLPNRTTFLETMAAAEEKIATGKTMAVLYVDLDNFKPINDNLGHAAGDAVLRVAAQRIGRVVGNHGMAARLGGDEFAALIGPLDGAKGATRIAEALIEALGEPVIQDGLEMTIGASIGIAMAPRDGTDTDALMRKGDLALYHAKNEGQGSYCLFENGMDERQKRRRAIEEGLKRALEKGELALYFQPLLSLEHSRVSGCEALMRWHSGTLGAVSAEEFIPVAEETGLIRDMGNWALRHACLAATGWPEHVHVAVNVSPVQFKGDDLVKQVKAALDDAGLAPERLELEITESILLADNAQNVRILHALRRLGVKIALDDFGTGYSSLSYLCSFPFNKIKIDRTFISKLAVRAETAPIVKTITELGNSLGMSTTAEGIETAEQLDLVRAQGCTEVQGYLFSPPLPESAIKELFGPSAQVMEKRLVLQG